MSGPFKMKGSSFYGHGNQTSGMPWVEAAMGIAKQVGGMMSKKDDKKDDETPGKYASPAKGTDHGVEGHKHDNKGKHVVSESRTKTSVTKTKGDKSSTYNVTNTEDRKDGSKVVTLTNDLGNSYKEIHSSGEK